MRRILSILGAAVIFAFPASPQTPDTRINPMVRQIVDDISEQRIAATLKKLESFGTRHVLSAQDDPAHGIGAAKRWIHDELQSYSARLQVSYQTFTIPKRQDRTSRAADVDNIIAVLPGTVDPDLCV